MGLVAISETEQGRVDSILASIEDQDWDKFEGLSAKAFISDSSMKEQFWHAVNSLQFPIAWQKNCSVNASKDGRLIEVFLETISGSEIELVLFSSTASKASQIEIWALADSADITSGPIRH